MTNTPAQGTVGASGRVLVLGGGGTLGATVCDVFRESGFGVVATHREDRNASDYLDACDDEAAIEALICRSAPLDAVINCIGVTRVDPSSPAAIEKAFLVNSVLPWKVGHVALRSRLRVIHMSTDGVFRGRRRQPYSETSVCDADDLYGLSKRAGEATLPNVLSVRTSIIGPDRAGRGLLEWFLRHPDRSEVDGYTNHVWNGVTTRQLALFFFDIVRSGAFDRLRTVTPLIHFSPNNPISKCQLLVLINKAYGRNIRVRPVPAPVAVTRILSSRFNHVSPMPRRQVSIAAALRELDRSASIQKRSSE
jgi:dTDP-4-dehydrorhamnose reductase